MRTGVPVLIALVVTGGCSGPPEPGRDPESLHDTMPFLGKPQHRAAVRDIKIPAPGDRLLSVGDDQLLYVWSVGDLLTPLLAVPAGGNPRHICLARDDRSALVALTSAFPPAVLEVRLDPWDSERIDVPSGVGFAAYYTCGDTQFVSFPFSGGVCTREIHSGRLLASARPFGGRLETVAANREKTHFAAVSCAEKGGILVGPSKLTVIDSRLAVELSHELGGQEESTGAQLAFLGKDRLALWTPTGRMVIWRRQPKGAGWVIEEAVDGLPSGEFSAVDVSSDGAAAWLAQGPHVWGMDMRSGAVLGVNRFLFVGQERAHYVAETIEAVCSVPGSDRVAVGLWDGHIALVPSPRAGVHGFTSAAQVVDMTGLAGPGVEMDPRRLLMGEYDPFDVDLLRKRFLELLEASRHVSGARSR